MTLTWTTVSQLPATATKQLRNSCPKEEMTPGFRVFNPGCSTLLSSGLWCMSWGEHTEEAAGYLTADRKQKEGGEKG